MSHTKVGPFTNGSAPALNAGNMDILDSQYDDAMADVAAAYSPLATLADILLVGAGIDPTGATDSTAAIQALLNAFPGRRFRLPAGVFLINSGLTLGSGQYLRGSGQQDWRNRANAFGDAAYQVNANYNGTIIRFSATTGVALTLLDTSVNTGGFEDFTLIGPGSGTSTGISVGSASMSVVNPKFNRVKVADFSVGVLAQNVNEGSFYDLMIRGCTTGINLTANTNNNAFHLLDIEYCGNGVIIDSTCVANSFYSHIAQSCTGIGVQISGQLNAFYNPYFENNTVRNMEILSGARGNAIASPTFGGSGDSIKIDSGALYTTITGHSSNAGATITNAGTGTRIEGAMGSGQLVDTGTGTVLIDSGTVGSAFGGSATLSPPTLTGITLGNGSVSVKYSKVGKRLFVEIKITIGSTTTISGAITVATLISLVNTRVPANAIIVQAASGNTYQGMAYVTSAGLVTIGLMNLSTYLLAPLSATSPITFASPDFIVVSYAADAA